ncbi:MAG: lytic transglycosylase domain-containing protein, partial [Chloroflexota bacterium]
MARKADRTSSPSRASTREQARPASGKRARRNAPPPPPPPPSVREKIARRLRRARWFGLAIVAIVALLDALFILGVIDRERLEDLWPFHWRRSGPQFITDSSAALAPFYAPAVLHWQDSIERWAREYEVNPNVIAIVMQIESCGDPEAVSSAGALGLMQVMPFHFSYGENMINPETNVRRGMSVFHECLSVFAG